MTTNSDRLPFNFQLKGSFFGLSEVSDQSVTVLEMLLLLIFT